jgi:alpha-tubulin suppressor-like RCC1 family protein
VRQSPAARRGAGQRRQSARWRAWRHPAAAGAALALLAGICVAVQVVSVSPALASATSGSALSAGYNHTCAIFYGGAYCEGDNTYGELGDKSSIGSSTAISAYTGGVLAGVTLTQVAAGQYFTCVLSSAGAVYCYGLNSSGQLGNNTTTNSNVPVAVIMSGALSGKTVTEISAGLNSVCAVASGKVYCWGNDTQGQLGNSSTTNSPVPVAVSTTGVLSGLTMTVASAGPYDACAISSAGAVYCWGADVDGQLGNNTASSTPSSVPVAVTTSGTPMSGVTVTQITVGNNFACALGGGAVYCWGYGTNGQLGNNATAESNVPVAVYATGVLSGVTVTQLGTGYDASCVLSSVGLAYCWGNNTYGQLGNNSTTQSAVPVAVSVAGVLQGVVLSQISAGQYYTCALATAGGGYCWGTDTSGQLGDPDVSVDFLVPVATVVPAEISAGYTHACMIRSNNVFCWGDNTYGELGNNSTISSPVPDLVYTGGVLSVPSRVVLTQVASGNGFTCALSQAGTVYCWGLNSSGQLGNNSSTNSDAPVAVTASGVLSGVDVMSINAGASSMCAVGGNGAVYCWGSESNGQLGNGVTTGFSSVPVAVTATTGTPLYQVAVAQVSSGPNAACALSAAGAVYCWGSNADGQLGNNSTTSTSTPVAVTVGAPSAILSTTVVTEISTGNNFACAVSGAGVAYCWGYDANGQLGNNATAESNVPVAVYTGGALSGKTLIQLDSGYDATCALDGTGLAYCWGNNGDDQLGTTSVTQSAVALVEPVGSVPAVATLAQLTGGQYFNCEVDSTGGPYCWGLNSSGQLGNTDTGINFTAPVAVSPQQATTLSAGYSHACELRGGHAFCWGSGINGQLGDNSTISSNVPVSVYTGGVLAGVTLTQISAGYNATCALSAAGAAYCWGYDATGQLGNNSTTQSNVPVAVSASGVLAGLILTQIVAGGSLGFTCAVASTGAAYCWGDDTDGELGNNLTTQSNVPVAVTATGALTGVTLTALSVGDASSCALGSVGVAYCWGTDTNGQLGNNSTTQSNVPVAVSTAGVLSGIPLTEIDSGANHTCVLSAAGLGYCWGYNGTGQLGNNSTTQSTVPVAVTTSGVLSGVALTQLTAGYQHTCALSSAGVGYCWGQGGLGNNTAGQSLVPVTVSAGAVPAAATLTQISSGGSYNGGPFTCALGNYGGAFCWGLNGIGQIGNPATAGNFLVPTAVAAPQATTIADGYTHSCMIRAGQAYCWGDNTYGELGTNSTMSSSVPVAVYTGGALSGVTLTQISAGNDDTCALSAAGAAYCWGYNATGQLGNNSTTQSTVPVVVSAGAMPATTILTQISSGGSLGFTCALSSLGAAYCWGDNTDGELGNNSTTQSAVPLAVSRSGALAGVTLIEITAGDGAVCGVASVGTAYCWGTDANGQLGNNSTTQSNVPVAVSTAGVLSGVTVSQIDSGANSTCALSTAGAAYCWGYNGSGGLGNNTTTQSLVPVAVTATGALSGVALTQISTGYQVACALSSADAGYCWGGGGLGNNTTAESNVPVAVSTSGVLSGLTLTQISAGGANLAPFACALDNTGASYCWGLDGSGQAGNPATGANFAVPVAVTARSTMVSVGQSHSCQLRNGKAYCWGSNAYGQLGNSSTTASSVPVPVYTGGVLSGVTLTQISAGGSGGTVDFTCALSSAGAVYCWGSGGSGQLGNGTTTSTQTTPVAVTTSGVLSGVTVTQIAVGSFSMCALSSAGAAYCWGAGGSGQLGNGSTTSAQTTAVAVSAGAVPSGATLTQISGKSSTFCALSGAGAAYCWGYGVNGELGNNTTANSTTPVAVTATGALAGLTLTAISAGFPDMCALATTGAAYCWGQNPTGGLGNGTTTQSNVPAAVTMSGAMSGATLIQITTDSGSAGSNDYSCALSTAGAAYCWGNDTSGQLGNNSTTATTTAVAVTTSGVLSGVSLFQIDADTSHTCAEDSTGVFYCWGDNTSGDLGNNSTTQSNVAVIVGIAPGPPTGVTATPGDTTATISWTAPTSFGSGTLTGYTATATAASGTYTCSTTGALTCVITGLTDITTYSVTVVTLTTDGSSVPSSPAVTVTPVGILSMTSPTSLTWAVTGSGGNQSAVDAVSGDQQLTATDNTGTGAGWNVTVSATTFTNGTHTLPNSAVLIFSGSLSSPASTTAPTAACATSCTLPTDTTTYPVAITTAASSPTTYKIYDTSTSTGEGVITIGGSAAANPIGWWVQVPASVYTGSYTSTVTLSVVSGP